LPSFVGPSYVLIFYIPRSPPNKIAARTLKESENGKELHKVSNIDELFQELNS
jgi:hypothetical protein